jgi:hypothetical protein
MEENNNVNKKENGNILEDVCKFETGKSKILSCRIESNG